MLVNYAQAPLATNVVTTAETVAATLTVDPVFANAPIGRVISGYLNVTPGAATTALVIRVRQGNTTGGALVGTADTVTVAAAGLESVFFSQVDTGVAPANNQYCVTVQQTAATGNGTVNDGAIQLLVPAPAGA